MEGPARVFGPLLFPNRDPRADAAEVFNGDSAVCDAFESGKPSEAQIAEALAAIKTGAAIQEAKSLSKRYAKEALKSVKKLPPSMYRNGLKTLVQLIIDRDF